MPRPFGEQVDCYTEAIDRRIAVVTERLSGGLWTFVGDTLVRTNKPVVIHASEPESPAEPLNIETPVPTVEDLHRELYDLAAIKREALPAA